MTVKGFAEVFTSTVRAEDFDGQTMLLRQCPGLKTLVGVEGFSFRVEEIGVRGFTPLCPTWAVF